MKRHLASLAIAGVIIGIAWALPALWHTEKGALGTAARLAMSTIYPAFMLLTFLGLGRGPEGLGTVVDAYVVTFVLLWLAIDYGSRFFDAGEEPDTQTK